MRWGLTGYYGFGNLGDDLMLAVLAQEIRHLDREAQITVLCPRGGNPPAVPGMEIMGPRTVRVADTWLRRLQAVRSVDALVFGGGTCLHRFGFCDLQDSLLARLIGRPVRWVGVGAEDPGGGLKRWKSRMALWLCGGAGFRDPESLEVAKNVWRWFGRGMVTGDLSFLLDKVTDPAKLRATPADPAGPVLLVSWRTLEGYVDEGSAVLERENAAASVVRAARELGYKTVRILNLADRVDQAANRTLAEAVQVRLKDAPINLEVLEPVSLPEKLRLLAEADMVVSVRLHGWLVAKILGTPAVGVAYADKVHAMAQELEGPGVVELDDLLKDRNALARVIAREHKEPASFRNMAGSRIGAERNLEIVADLLTT